VDPRGNLTPIESYIDVDFQIARLYYLYDVPGGSSRGGHAHRNLNQVLVAISGSFNVLLDDGVSRQTYTLNRPYYGLRICPMTWRELDNFSSASVCLVVASLSFSEDDYIRNYEEFKIAVRA